MSENIRQTRVKTRECYVHICHHYQPKIFRLRLEFPTLRCKFLDYHLYYNLSLLIKNIKDDGPVHFI